MDNPSTTSPIPASQPNPKASDPATVTSKTDSKGNAWLTSFAVIGDFGNVGAKKNNLYTENDPVNYVGEAIRKMAPDFIISLGDDNYVEGKREWKDFNVGKNFAPYIQPYKMLNANKNNPDAQAIASPSYLASQVPRKTWNRFFTAPGNHELGMSGGKGSFEASGRRDWSHDAYYKPSMELSKQQGSVIPIAGSYVKPGDGLYYDYAYGTSWNPTTAFKTKEGAMDPSYFDYIVKPVNKNGKVLSDLANIYMVDRNIAAYPTKNTAYLAWKKKNPNATLDPQAQHLMDEGKRRDKDVPWQIFASHYQTDSSEAKQDGMQLPFFKNGFDLVMGAHVHNYERIHSADSAGVKGDYIVNGVGGYNTSYSGNDQLDELFAPIGKVAGYKAGSTGKWGFGWVDMNQDELMYRQFTVDFTAIKNPWPIGIAVKSYTGKEPISSVKITEVDRLVLKKNASPTTPSTSLQAIGEKTLVAAASHRPNANTMPAWIEPSPLAAIT